MHVDAVDVTSHIVILAERLAANGADGVANLLMYTAYVPFEVTLALEGALARLTRVDGSSSRCTG